MATASERRQALRAKIEAPGIVVAPSVHLRQPALPTKACRFRARSRSQRQSALPRGRAIGSMGSSHSAA